MNARTYFNESHQLFRATVRRFVQREIIPHLNDWEEAGSFPRELYRKAAEHGLLGIGFEEAYGGIAGDIFHWLVVFEELTRSGAQGIPAGLCSHGIGLPPIQNQGTPEQKERFLRPVLAGEKISALAITEPNAGSDVAQIETRAIREGRFYRVNGAKMFITSGTRADFITAAVRTGGAGYGGVSVLVIEAQTPGFSVSQSLKKMGWWCSDTAELVFEDCLVPVENLIGAEGQGFKILMQNFEMERLGLAAMAYTSAQIAWEAARDYARQRKIFGELLINKQVIRHKLAEMLTQIEVAREYVYRVADRLESGEIGMLEVAMAKNFCTQVCDFVAHEAVQIYGGMGYMRGTLVERIYRDSRLLSIGGGTSEIMKEIICKTSGIDSNHSFSQMR